MFPLPLFWMIRILAWLSLPLVPLWPASAFWLDDKPEMVVTGIMIVCVLCAVTWLTVTRSEKRFDRYRQANSEEQAALIRTVDRLACPADTGPHPIARPADAA